MMALPIAAGAIGGWLIDRHFDTRPFWVLTLLSLGIGVAIIQGISTIVGTLHRRKDE